MPECIHCGSHVTPDYWRVFSLRDGDVHGCPRCRGSTNLEIHAECGC